MNELKKKEYIYSLLSDEESKNIWKNKVKFNETRNYEYLENIVKEYISQSRGVCYLKIENKIIKEITEKNKKIVIFGAGFQGKRMLEICKSEQVGVEFFCDNAQEKWHTIIDDVLVISIDELMEKENKEQFAFIVTPEFVDVEIKKELLKRGVEEENIYLYNKLYLLNEKQYFDEDIISLEDNEVFIDGGCLDFETSFQFLKRMKEKQRKIKKIYSFEPDAINLEKCKKKIKELNVEDVEVVNAGLWNKDTYLEFRADGDSGSCIIETFSQEKNKVKVTALDNIVKEKVTFIKFDIEGAELKALQGAEKIILRDKPKLAISVYHKNEDMWEIPYYIKSLVSEYKLYIRHYSNCEWETVLYAVIK